jgi:hypothetical protein
MNWAPFLAGVRRCSALRLAHGKVYVGRAWSCPLEAGRRGAHRQDDCDRTSGPVPATLRRRCTRALRTAAGGLKRSETRPLMLVEQPAELSVLRSQRSFCVAHSASV